MMDDRNDINLEGRKKDMEESSFFGKSKVFLGAILLILFALGLWIRLDDFTDPPLDFHPTRQLRSAIIARSLYYRSLPEIEDWHRERAIGQFSGEGIIEPPVLETIVAATYRIVGSDPVWIARIYSSIFWIIGGLALYFLTSAMTSPDGGVLAVAYYLFVPFGIIASRSFQPDPMMVMCILLALWALYDWHRRPSWKTAILAGGLAGIALFVKAVALFPILFVMGGLFLLSRGIRKGVRDPQLWAIIALTLLPVVAYNVYGVAVLGTMGSQWEGRFFPEMWRTLRYYFNWEEMASGIVGYGWIFVALVGALLFTSPALRAFGIALWLGYLVYGITFPYHITSHTYYHLPLIPVIAINLAPVGAIAFKPLVRLQNPWFVRLFVAGVLFAGVMINTWGVHVDMTLEDYRHEPGYWAKIGEILGPNAEVIGLTHDYGNRLAYYGWITPQIWPALGQQSYRELQGKPPIEVQAWFAEKAGSKDFFLVTMMNQFEKQPELKKILEDYYPVYAEGDGYLIFDLRNPLGN